MQQCGCCALPFRGQARRALVIGERSRPLVDATLERVCRFANVCPRCAARGTLLCAIPPDAGERRQRPREQLELPNEDTVADLVAGELKEVSP